MQKLADKINERWSGVIYAYYSAEREQLEIYQDAITGFRKGICAFLPSDSDAWNAQFIVWGLERLSELGFFWSVDNLRLCTSEGKFRVICVRGSSAMVDISAPGETFAQAVYNALCKALEVEP